MSSSKTVDRDVQSQFETLCVSLVDKVLDEWTVLGNRY